MTNPILYVILNGSLKMSPGKAAAQTAHAVMMLENNYREEFMSNYRRTVVVLSASGREQLDGIADYLSDSDLHYVYYTDEGMNEVEAFSMTAMAIEPIDADDETHRQIFSSLPLYGKPDTDGYGDEEDEYAGVTCESEQTHILNTVAETNRQVYQLGRKLDEALKPKPESAWKRFWTYRAKKTKSWVS